jgi:hypothetical protein
MPKSQASQKTTSDDQSNNSTQSKHDSSIESISDSIAHSVPDVQQHAIDSHVEKENQLRAEWAELEDKDGNKGFDPKIHKSNAAGEPVLSKLGRLIRKPTGRPPTENKGVNSSIGGVGAPVSEADQAKIAARASGAMAANLLITLGVVAGGEEWHPLRDETTGLDEKVMLEKAFGDYFEATGREDIPPGLALTAAVAGYAIPRFTKPKTKSRLKRVGDWAKGKYALYKMKKYKASMDNSKSADLEVVG